jgi:predicted dehydrogenase
MLAHGALTERINGDAIRVPHLLGPGFLGSIDEHARCGRWACDTACGFTPASSGSTSAESAILATDRRPRRRSCILPFPHSSATGVQPMAKIIRYGVIGGGAIAQRRHLPEIDQHPDATVAAIADPVTERVQELAEQYDAKPFGDYQKMLADDSLKLDAVVVAGPNKLHAPMTIDALRAGFHVLCEKPMAGNRAEARKMIKTAADKKKYLMIGMNQRLMPPHAKAREVLETGRLGKVLTFETTFKHAGPDGWSVDGAKSWFFKKDPAQMGVCGDLGIHKADLMRFLLGEEITRVGGFVKTLNKKGPNGKMIPLDDNAFITMETQSGTIGTMTISWTNYGRFEDNGTTLYCEHGVMRLGQDDTYGVMVDYADGQKERHVVGQVATNDKQVSSGVSTLMTEAILNRRKPEIDGHEGYKALNVIITAIEAAKAGKMMNVKQG